MLSPFPTLVSIYLYDTDRLVEVFGWLAQCCEIAQQRESRCLPPNAHVGLLADKNVARSFDAGVFLFTEATNLTLSVCVPMDRVTLRMRGCVCVCVLVLCTNRR